MPPWGRLAPSITDCTAFVDPSKRLGAPIVTLVEEARLERLAALYAASVTYVPPRRRQTVFFFFAAFFTTLFFAAFFLATFFLATFFLVTRFFVVILRAKIILLLLTCAWVCIHPQLT
jgi:polyferredoxin